MSFKVNGALFRQTAEQLQHRLGTRYDPSKSYPEMDGVMNVTTEQVSALVEYLTQAAPQGERQEIPVRISGWTKLANSGKKYLSLNFQPDNKVLKEIEDRRNSAPTQQQPMQQQTWQATTPSYDDDVPF